MDIEKLRGFIGMMSLSDKISLTGGENKIEGIDRPKLESVFFGNGLLPYDVTEPYQIAVGCAFSRDVAERVALFGLRKAVESGYAYGGTVSCGLIRDPMRVSASEFFSEDPYLTGELLKSYAVSCGIGFVFTNALGQETFVNRTVDERALHEIYLNPLYRAGKYAAALQLDGGRLNGEKASSSRTVGEIYARYVYQTAALFGRYCNEYSFDEYGPSGVYGLGATKNGKLKLKKAVESGDVQVRAVDESIVRTLAAMVDAHELYKNPISAKITSAEPPDLAVSCSVLLKNDGVLPARAQKLVLFGKREIFNDGNYRVLDVAQAKKCAGALNVFLIAEYEKDGIDGQTVDAIKTAAKAGAVVAVVCGCCAVPIEFDRYAGAVMFCPLIPKVSEIIDMIYGVAPRGRLPFTWCGSKQDYPCNNKKFAHRGDFRYESVYNGYLLFNNFDGSAVRYPFGHGSDYTTYRLSKLGLSSNGVAVRCELDVENCGSRDGEAVLQAYVSYRSKTVYGIYNRLACVKRALVKSGATERVAMDIDLNDISVYNEASGEYAVLGGKYEIAVGLSSADIRVKDEIKISAGVKIEVGLPQSVAPSYYAVGKKFAPTAPEIEKLLKVPFIKKTDDCPELALPPSSVVAKRIKNATKRAPRSRRAVIEYKIKTTPINNSDM